jgi:hypothetical protein
MSKNAVRERSKHPRTMPALSSKAILSGRKKAQKQERHPLEKEIAASEGTGLEQYKLPRAKLSAVGVTVLHRRRQEPHGAEFRRFLQH